MATDNTTKDEIELQICKKLTKRKTQIKLDPRNKPVMTPATEAEVESALVQYESRTQWREWGLDILRKQGAAVLLHGPPGTGKTVIAEYMSKRVGRGLMRLNMKDVGGKAPGDTERRISELFAQAQTENHKTIFLDECEAILWDRSKAGSDSMWMVGVVDELLMRIAEYRGLIILATNRVEIVDTALVDRCFANLQIGTPDFPERVRLWKQKIPARYPFQPTQLQLEKLAQHVLSGRSIENALVREASHAIREQRKPTFASLQNVAIELSKK